MANPSKREMKVVSAVKARTRFGYLLDEAEKGKHHFIIERKGIPIAAILSIDEYEDYIDMKNDDNPEIKKALVESQKDYKRGRISSLDDLQKSMKPLKKTSSKV